MSTPALKPRPSAARMSARTSGSVPNRRTMSASSNHPATLSALTGGLSITTSATPSEIECEIPMGYFLVAKGSGTNLPDGEPAPPGQEDLVSERQALDLSGQVVLVTGGARGV